jgi:hypothetical protein
MEGMTNLQERSSTSRIFAFIVLLALIPAWFFYIGMQYAKTISILEGGNAASAEILSHN